MDEEPKGETASETIKVHRSSQGFHFETFNLRIHMKESPGRAVNIGRSVSQHEAPRRSYIEQFNEACEKLKPAMERIDRMDAWHVNALYDILASELSLGIRSGIADYVWNELRPSRYTVEVPKTVRPSRTVDEIKDFIVSFPNTDELLQHIFAYELDLLREEGLLEPKDLQLRHEGKVTRIEYDHILDVIRTVADEKPTNSTAVKSIWKAAYADLFYALRTKDLRFSVSVNASHQTAIQTLNHYDPEVYNRLVKYSKRLTSKGEVRPQVREYVYLVLCLLTASALFITNMLLNWARRNNWLERVFDSVGLFGLTTSIMLAVLSQRADVVSMLWIIIGRRRYLHSCAEVLDYLQMNEEEMKSALTFKEARVPPLSGRTTNYAYEKHEGLFLTETGLSSHSADSAIVMGNKNALWYTDDEELRYFAVVNSPRGIRLSRAEDAQFRIVSVGDVLTTDPY